MLLLLFFKRFDLQGAKPLIEGEHENIACKDSEGPPSTHLLSIPVTPPCPPRVPGWFMLFASLWCCLSLENLAKLPRGRILDIVCEYGEQSCSESERCVLYRWSPQVDQGTRTSSYSLREMSQLPPYPKERPIQATFCQSSLLYGLCITCFCLKWSDLCMVCLARMKAPGQQRPCLRLLRRT